MVENYRAWGVLDGKEGERETEKEESHQKISRGGGKNPTKISFFSFSFHFQSDLPERTILSPL